MIITMPVYFTANVIPKGGRTEREMDFYVSAPMEIAEVSGYDAPIAIRGIKSRFVGRLAQQGDHTRWYDGSNWIEDKPGHGEFEPRKWVESIMGRGSSSNAWDDFLAKNEKHEGLWNHEPFVQDGIKKVTWSGLEEAQNNMLGFCRDLLVVDGVLYHRVDPPLFYLGSINGVKWTGIDFGTDWLKRKFMHASFDFFMIDRATDFAMHVGQHFPEAAELPDQPEILIPEAVVFPDEEHTLAHAAGKCIEALEEHLPSLTERQGIAWFRLRAAWEPMLKYVDFSSTRAEALANALEHLKWTLEAEPTRSHNMLIREDSSGPLCLADHAMSRWTLRPVMDDDIRIPGNPGI